MGVLSSSRNGMGHSNVHLVVWAEDMQLLDCQGFETLQRIMRSDIVTRAKEDRQFDLC